MTLFIPGVAMVAIALFLWGDNMRNGLPKFDLLLASTAAAPAAMRGVVQQPVEVGAIRLFVAPLVEFEWGGVPAYLTAPDVLALASSFILICRFLSWTVCPTIAKIKRQIAKRRAAK